MEEIEAIFAELRKFSPDIADFDEPANPALIDAFEVANQVRLPLDYRLAMQQSNGFSIMGDEIYGVHGVDVPLSLESIYHREHFEVRYPQPTYLVPFSPDGGGNFYCFDTRYPTKDGYSCQIVFWVSNYQYTDEDVPEVVYSNFIDFVDKVLIGWTLKAFDYEGNER